MSPPIKDIELEGEVEVRQKVRVVCTCGRWVVLGEFGAQNEPVALHPQPQCKFFKDSDLLTYIRTLRQRYEGN